MAIATSPDPCSMAEQLRAALAKLVAGEGVALVEHEAGNGTRRRIEYHKANIAELRTELARYEQLCCGKRRAKIVKFSTSKGV